MAGGPVMVFVLDPLACSATPAIDLDGASVVHELATIAAAGAPLPTLQWGASGLDRRVPALLARPLNGPRI